MMNGQKILYATKFNTLPVYVKYWNELDERQQAQAIVRFSGLSMTGHIYQIGIDQSIVARRRLEFA